MLVYCCFYDINMIVFEGPLWWCILREHTLLVYWTVLYVAQAAMLNSLYVGRTLPLAFVAWVHGEFIDAECIDDGTHYVLLCLGLLIIQLSYFLYGVVAEHLYYMVCGYLAVYFQRLACLIWGWVFGKPVKWFCFWIVLMTEGRYNLYGAIIVGCFREYAVKVLCHCVCVSRGHMKWACAPEYLLV
jgi:hypothetical protein